MSRLLPLIRRRAIRVRYVTQAASRVATEMLRVGGLAVFPNVEDFYGVVAFHAAASFLPQCERVTNAYFAPAKHAFIQAVAMPALYLHSIRSRHPLKISLRPCLRMGHKG